MKKDLVVMGDVMQKLGRINPVTFSWNIDQFPDKEFTSGRQIGLVAQEVEKEFPEFVSADADGYKGIAYDKFTAVLLAAIKEQQKQIDGQNKKIERLEKLIGKKKRDIGY